MTAGIGIFNSFEPPVLSQIKYTDAFEITFQPDSSTFSQDKASVAVSYTPHPWAAHRLRALICGFGKVITTPSQKQELETWLTSGVVLQFHAFC